MKLIKNQYKIVHDFQVKHLHVLQLDSDYEYGNFDRILIEGKIYKYTLNSIDSWVVIESKEYINDSLKGKIVEFVKYTDETNERIAV